MNSSTEHYGARTNDPGQADDVVHPEVSVDSVRQQLLSQVGQLAAAVRRAYRWRAVLWMVCAILVLLAALVGADLLLRAEELGLRLLFSLVGLAGVVTAILMVIAPAWRLQVSRVDLAGWIERSQPELGERLSTAMQFAETAPNDLRFGSRQFRDAALLDWSRISDRVDWTGYLRSSAWSQPLIVMCSLTLLFGGLTLWRAADVQHSLARLFMPLAKLPWPQADQLQFVNLPSVLTSGQELYLEVIDQRPPLPETIELQVRPVEHSNSQDISVYPMRNLDASAVVTLAEVDQAIEVRAIGGDDYRMAWQRIDVAQAPKLTSHQFQIEPPKYSGRPPLQIVGHRIQVLAGSRVTLSGSFAEPIARLTANPLPATRHGGTPATGATTSAAQATEPAVAEPRTLPSVNLASNQRDFNLLIGDANTPPGTITFRLGITTREEVTIDSSEIWTVEVVADAVPAITLAEQELAQVAPQATLTLRGQATDDLGLSSIELVWNRLNNQPSTLPPTDDIGELPQADNVVAVELAPAQRVTIWSAKQADVEAGLALREFTIEHAWEIASKLDLRAGDQLQLWLEARDTLGQVGQSNRQNLEVRDPQQILEALTQQQSLLLEQLQSLTDTQRRNAQLVQRSAEIIQQANDVRREEQDALANASQVQLSVNNQLQSERGSVSANLEQLANLLNNNGLGDSALAQQTAEARELVKRLAEMELSTALRDVQAALEAVKSEVANRANANNATQQSLARAAASQNDALSAMQALTDRMLQSEGLRAVERELAQLLNQQQTLRNETDQLEVKRLSGLNKSEFRAESAGLQADQQGLAQSVEQLQKRATALANAMPAEQSNVKSQVERAIEQLADSQVSQQMRAAAGSLASERFSDATQTQQAVVDALQQALQRLSSTGQRGLDGQLGQQAATTQQLQQLATQQAALAQEFTKPDANRTASALADQQQQLRQAVQRQKSQLQQAGDGSALQSLDQASQAQELAAQAAQQSQMASAAKQAQRAAAELNQAVEQSQQRAERLQRQVAQQQLLQLGTALKQLVDQQTPVVDALFDVSQVPIEQLDAEDRQRYETEAKALAGQQERIRQAVRDVRQRADKLPAFDWTLQQTEADMARAVAAAERLRLSPEAVDASRAALRKLTQAAEAMKRTESPNSDKPSPDTANAEQQSQNDGKPVPPLASLKLLRGLQADINAETQQLAAAPATITEAERIQRAEKLAADQQALGLQLQQILLELSASMDTNQ